MTVAAAFKTRQPALIANYLAAREVDVTEFNAKVDAFKATIGGREVFGIRFFDGGFSISGYRAVKYGEDLPPGWRFDGAKKDVVPAKRTPEGKEIAKTLAGLRLKGNSYPGAPDIMFADGFSLFPHVEKIGDDFYLTVSRAPLSERGNNLDPEIWEPVKLSEYHAALEATDVHGRTGAGA